MSHKEKVIAPSDRNTALNVIGVNVTVLTDSKAQKITLQSGAEGAGPPPHSHPWDESFYVTKGMVHFICSGQTSNCYEGTLVNIPAGTVHAFSFGEGGGEMLEITTSNSKAISMFSALDHEIPSGPPDVPKGIEVAGEYDVKFHL
jgi:quercetin dioxygenase-like cupin family protein